MAKYVPWSGFLLAFPLMIGSSLASEPSPSPLELFEQRIVPIFKSPDPSSCVQCHLSSVDLKDYILPSSKATFLALRDQGLINLADPKQSKILDLIAMGELDSDKLAERIHAKTRQQEYEALTAWISACCADQELVALKREDEGSRSGPEKPNSVIRHTRKDRILDSFERNIWSQRMRCFPCHTPSEIDPDNPMHAMPAERHREFVEQYGQRMNIFKASPEETLRALVNSSRKTRGDDLPLINTQKPLESLLLLKPMAKLPPKGEDGKLGKPSSALPVSHMGGIKMHKDDHSYKAFAVWLEDYAKSVNGGYSTVQDLPEDNWFATDYVIRIADAPETWPVMATVQVFVHAWDEKKQAWSNLPVAFTQGKVAPRRLVVGSLFLIATREQRAEWPPEGPSMGDGKYQFRIFVDHKNEIELDPTMMLSGRVPDANIDIEAAWQTGFKNAQVVDGKQLALNADSNHR